MKAYKSRWLSISMILVFALASACGSKTPAAESTSTPTDASGAATPGTPPANAGNAPFQLSTEEYVSPSGAFSLYPPDGWSVDDSDMDAFFQPDDEKGAIYVQVTNTVVALDDDAFGAFVRAREFNFFSKVYDDYEASEPEYDAAADAYLANKTLTLDKKPQAVGTIYYRKGAAIYSIDYWAEADAADAYFEVYKGIVLEVDPKPAADMVGYFFNYNFAGPENLYAIDVPIHWQWEHNTEGKNVTDSFLSPDGKAGVHITVYNDEIARGLNEAAGIALSILNKSHTSGAGDVEVTGETQVSERSANFNWKSSGGGVSGSTTIELRGATILLFTVLSSDGFADAYNPVLNDIMATRRVP